MRVLVVDDDCVTGELLANALGKFGYTVTVANDGCQALELARTGLYRLVVSDWEMPGMSGVEFCRQIRKRSWSGYIYVILLTSFSGVENVVRGLDAGADDFLTKPFQPQELRVRLRAGERVLALESREVTIFALAKLAESRDSETGTHLERIREYCRVLGDELSHWDSHCDIVDGEYVQLLYLTSPLHDIGKVGIPDRVLLKPGRLTPEEFAIMKQHTTLGANTLEAAAKAHTGAPFLTIAREIALTHHERFDGKGYPGGLRGTEIPLSGRIVALADVYDALTSRRVYKDAFSHEAARDILLEGCGTQFDPDIVKAFLNREDEFIAIRERLGAEDAAPELFVADASQDEPSVQEVAWAG